MTGLRFVLAMGWRESRASRRMLLLLVGAVAVGVAALVAIRSFGDGLRDQVRRQARALLGADLALGSGARFSPQAEALLAELRRTASASGEARLARVTSFGAMALVPERRGVRLVQVMGVEAGYPFYGEVLTDPPLEWQRLTSGRYCLVDPAVLIALDAAVGDSLVLGEARFVIRGTVRNIPGDVGVRTSLGPRVFIARTYVEDTRLLGVGARVRHEAYLALPAGANPERLVARYRPALAALRVTLRTVAEDQRRIEQALGRLRHFLGLVGLIAMLLGGIGVASAIHVLIRRRIDTVAVLRCLGASSGRVLAVYVVQAVAIGLAGSVLGATLGAALQLLLPRVLRGFLPIEVEPSLSWTAVLLGTLVGVWTAAGFALLPLLAVRRISPLLALRRDYEPAPRPRDLARAFALLLLAASVVAIAALQAESLSVGLAFAAGIGLALSLLTAAALLLRRALRLHVSPKLSYVWRQGLLNLHRPANQTLAVVLSLGFGVFLLGTLLVLQHGLLRELRFGGDESRANLVLLDVQRDQLGALDVALNEAGAATNPAIPIVPMRLHSVKSIPVSQILAQTAAGTGPRSRAWLYRREFRSTYRDFAPASERIVAGKAWAPGEWRARRGVAIPVSLEAEVARDLGVSLGDEIVWDVQGVLFPSLVMSLREVSWARFEPNFFAVFPSGPLDDAPQTFVRLARIDEALARAQLERRVVERFPNVSTLDLAEVQRSIAEILNRVTWAVRFMASFSVAAGLVVLLGSVATSRQQRLRESALVKTLGATRRQILRIVVAEYASLGGLAALTGILLAVLAGWALLRFVFEADFALPAAPLAALAAVVVLMTALLGALGSLEVSRKTPLEVLRAE